MRILFGVVASALSVAFAVHPSEYVYRTKEAIYHPLGWQRHSRPSPSHTITLRIGLPQPNFTVLEKHLYEVSDPDHKRYGQHLSKEEVETLIQPHPESLNAVNEWLYSFDLDETNLLRSPGQDWIIATLPVHIVEDMLNTTYYVWKHRDGDSMVRTTSYSLPVDLHKHIDVVQPTTMFARFNQQASTIFSFEDDTIVAKPYAPASSKTSLAPVVDPSCNTTITVSCLAQLYNFVGYNASNSSKNSVGITGYLEQWANIQDLQTFYSEQRPDAVNSSFNFLSVAGGINDQNITKAGAEANLDVQFAFGISYPIPSTFWSTGGRPPFTPDVGTPTNTNEPYQEWIEYVLTQKNPPLSISTSYGDHEQTVPESYARRVCAGFAQLGVRGVSILFSSGDGGVGDGNSDPATQHCFTNDGKNITRFIPLFPASCPFVTSVGGTQDIDPEVAVTRYYSGGGFSDYFPRPFYQSFVVDKYLKALPKGLYKGLYNPLGRAIPDVAAQGDRFRIWYRGRAVRIGGTSASSPAFAGIVSLLNDARLKAHKPPLGFLNPLLYTKGISGFTDILIGSNPGCGTGGFNVTKGWDPVTGLGTPDFRKLVKIVT